MAGFLSDGIREQVRAANDIVDVIGSYLPLKRAGANFTTLCPFHKEKTPSFHVSAQRQTFHCFGCNKGGDVFTFVMEYDGVDFPEALKRLADRAKIPLLREEEGSGESLSRHLKDSLFTIHDQIAQRWQNALDNDAAGQIARDYLVKRGVSDEARQLFRIGYAPDTWDDTVNWARSKEYDNSLMEKAGLIIRKEDTDRYYDRFRGRLIFPICDEQGRVVGFSGRILSGDEKTAKYVNSPETPIFIKSKVFFGLNKTKRAILDSGYAIICEGQIDLISCFMAGIQNIVAPQGTALTADHTRILKRFADEVVLCFDSDNAGQNATVRSFDALLASGLAVKVATIPAPHDPDSYVKSLGGPAFKQLIEQAEGFFDYLLGRLCATNELSSDKGRIVVLRSMAEAVHKTGNIVLVDKYAQKTALRLGVEPDAVRVEFKKISRSHVTAEQTDDTPATSAGHSKPPPHEYWLLKLLLCHDDLQEWASAYLDPSWLEGPLVREAITMRLASYTNQTWQSLPAFLDSCVSAELRSLVTEATISEREVPNPAQQVVDITLRLRNQFFDRKMASIMHRLNQPETNEIQRLELLRLQQELRDAKRQPLAPLAHSDQP